MNSFKTLLCLAFEWWLWTNHCGQETVRSESMGKALVVFTQNQYQSQSHVGSLVVMVQAPRLALPSQFVWLPAPRLALPERFVHLFAMRFYIPVQSVQKLYHPASHVSDVILHEYAFCLWCDFLDNVERLINFSIFMAVLYLLKFLVGLCERVKQHLFQ